MKKLLFSALACVAFAGSGFASNEIIVDLPSVPEEKSKVVDKEVEEGGFGICNTTYYGYYQTYQITQSTGLDGVTRIHVFSVFRTTGGCETCHYLGGSTTECWGFGY